MTLPKNKRIATRVVLFTAASMMVLVVASSNVFSQQAPSVGPTAESPNKDKTDANPQAQTSSDQIAPAGAVPPSRRLDCQHPADPHRRHMGCKDEEFDWDETLSQDWTGIRSKMRQVGISPSLSYTGALQTNATGGPHQIWSYAGQVVAGLSVDLEKLLKVPGMSVYVGGSWGTGSNLSGSLHNLFPVNSFYAPTYYLGEMYLQQICLTRT